MAVDLRIIQSSGTSSAPATRIERFLHPSQSRTEIWAFSFEAYRALSLELSGLDYVLPHEQGTAALKGHNLEAPSSK